MDDTIPMFSELALDSRTLVKNLVITAVLWTLTLVFRAVAVQALRGRGMSPAEVRRLMATSRNVAFVVIAIGTATVWFEELKTLAFSLVAFAAAIVIATKELIMGAGGTFLRTSSRSFEIGDRIEINGVRGDVIDTTLFTTTLLEIGPGQVGHQQTGRSITLPNSLFLLQPVVNESYSDAFLLHTFHVPIAGTENWADAERDLLEAILAEQAPFSADARAHFERIAAERGIEPPNLDPRVLLSLETPDRLLLISRLAVPARKKGLVEQAIVRRFLDRQGQRRAAASSAAKPHFNQGT